MKIKIENQAKARIAKYGANKLFVTDSSDRKKMHEQKLIDLFDQVWSYNLERLILESEICPLEEVYRRLNDKQQNFVDENQEHRIFKYQNADFIVQLKPDKLKKEYDLTDLWLYTSSDKNPKAIFIEFSSVEEKDLFKSLADSLRIKDNELGLKLLRNFMELHPGYHLPPQISRNLEQ